MSTVHPTDDTAARYHFELRLGKVRVSSSGVVASALMLAVLFTAVASMIWAVGATYVMLAGVSLSEITDAALLKAAAILGAFILFAYLVGLGEIMRWRERQLDAEFEFSRHRHQADART